MEQKVYDTYVAILKNELKVALGCTEPIAIAYVGAKVREVLGKMPEHIDVYCSGNIVKNVKAVVVPNSDGQRGIDVAAALGVIGGDASLELAVLESVKPEDISSSARNCYRKTSWIPIWWKMWPICTLPSKPRQAMSLQRWKSKSTIRTSRRS